MRKYYLVLLCCLRDRHQLQTSVKDNKQYPFFFISFLLTVLDIINLALGLIMILNMFLSNSFFFFSRKVVAHVNYLRLTRSRSNPQWSSMRVLLKAGPRPSGPRPTARDGPVARGPEGPSARDGPAARRPSSPVAQS